MRGLVLLRLLIAYAKNGFKRQRAPSFLGRKRSPKSRLEVQPMNPEWIIAAKCPQEEGMRLEETIRTCTECPYKIWNHPISVLGSNSAMSSITLGKLADELDSIANKIGAIKEFTAQNLSPTERIRTLERIKECQEGSSFSWQWPRCVTRDRRRGEVPGSASFKCGGDQRRDHGSYKGGSIHMWSGLCLYGCQCL